MARIKKIEKDNGFFGIGILNNVDAVNIGTLWRSAYIMGASFIFTIDKKYRQTGTDVTSAWSKIPLYHYHSFADFKAHLPYSTKLIGVELDDRAIDICQYQHVDRAVYLLGNERSGLPKKIVDECHDLIKLPGEFSLNVSVAGSLVMYDRYAKLQSK
ncbi:RNA methyltransferase [Thalassotalea aquiviva]|uniref:RNA methyltransferase n=1 Tax=Thalassotalea aquiviva TaxID=3242415 RepID=UPI00352B1B8A